jgi:CheY-like chemotaxis protein
MSKRHLLLIDTDEPSRILIKDILAACNITITEATTGWEALHLFEKLSEQLQLVLLDIKLPDCNGWDLLKHFRQINPLVILIAVSAMPKAELARRCNTGEIDAYISKPFDIEEFKKLIAVFLK